MGTLDYRSRAWSKPFLAHLGEDGDHQLLSAHLLGVSKIAGRLAAKLDLQDAGAILGLLHDVGKYSVPFQEYLLSMDPGEESEPQHYLKGHIDHSTAGAQILWRARKDINKREKVVAEMLSLCIASHHSGLIDCVSPDGTDKFSLRMQKAERDCHREEAWENMDGLVRARAEQLLQSPPIFQELESLLARLRRHDEELIRKFYVGMLVRFLFSCLIDADRTDTADDSKRSLAETRQSGHYVAWDDLIALLEEELARFPCDGRVDILRTQVSGLCKTASERNKGAYTLTVPTGGGKTLASLRFALHHAAKWGMDRIIYVSPYTSIIDQNAAVVRAVLEPAGTPFASVVLEYHSNLSPTRETARSRLLAENWDAPVVFTTLVQLLETLFGGGTRSVRRMHALTNAVLVFDEVQTLPVRVIHMFNNAANFLIEQGKSTILLCTATQPLLHRVDKRKGALALQENAELMPNVKELFEELKRYDTLDRRKTGGWSHEEVADLAVAEASTENCCLVVLNTKLDALKVYGECKDKASNGTVFHLSTGMCPAHRMSVLNEIKTRLEEKQLVICVSTQLIEAGIDIDFASVVRDIAGIDSLVQAAGRCNRHGKRPAGQVHIINLAGGIPSSLKEIKDAQGAGQRVLDEARCESNDVIVDLSNPGLLETYFNYHFHARQVEMSYPVHLEERDDTLLNMLGRNTMAVASSREDIQVALHQSFMSASKSFEAVDKLTQGIVVPYGAKGRTLISKLCSTADIPNQRRLLRQAQQYTVNLFASQIQRLPRGAIVEVQPETGILYLNESYYNDEFGFSASGGENLEGLVV